MYAPLSSVKRTLGGAYIMHEPAGLPAKQVSALPAGATVGRVVFFIWCTIYIYHKFANRVFV